MEKDAFSVKEGDFIVGVSESGRDERRGRAEICPRQNSIDRVPTFSLFHSLPYSGETDSCLTPEPRLLHISTHTGDHVCKQQLTIQVSVELPPGALWSVRT
jgi:hypothetical protein